MVSTELARRLRDSGVSWTPASGDRFVITQPDLEGDVFTVSEMTIEAHHYPTATILGFNGTTEWALDSVDIHGTLWLPREDQLRELLGPAFRALETVDEGFVVRVMLPGGREEAFVAGVAADAYALALLAVRLGAVSVG